MFILQNLKDFIENPMGKGSNAIPSRQLIKNDLMSRFESKILGDRSKKVDFTVYKRNGEYYFHFIIPSEGPSRRNTYDVVLHFTLDDSTQSFKGDKNLNRYLVKFFSNNPSFVFTYAYSFNLYGLFISELGNKYADEVLENMPVTRNPAEVISYEKSTFFACAYLLKHPELMVKSTLDTMAKRFSEGDFKRSIRTLDQIQLEYKAETHRLDEEEKKNSAKSNKPSERKGTVNKTEPRSRTTAQRSSSGNNRITPKQKIGAKGSTVNKIKPR